MLVKKPAIPVSKVVILLLQSVPNLDNLEFKLLVSAFENTFDSQSLISFSKLTNFVNRPVINLFKSEAEGDNLG